MFYDVMPVFDQFVAEKLLCVSTDRLELWESIDDILCEMKAIVLQTGFANEIVEHHHIECCCCSSFFLVPMHMQVVVIGAVTGEAVNQPRIAMIVKHDRFIAGKDAIKISVAQTVRIYARRLKRH